MVQSKEVEIAPPSGFGVGHGLAAQKSLGTSNTLIRCIIVNAVQWPTVSYRQCHLSNARHVSFRSCLFGVSYSVVFYS